MRLIGRRPANGRSEARSSRGYAVLSVIPATGSGMTEESDRRGDKRRYRYTSQAVFAGRTGWQGALRAPRRGPIRCHPRAWLSLPLGRAVAGGRSSDK